MAYTGASPALTSRETAVLKWADEGGRARITTGDIQGLFGNRAGIKVVSSLARKGVLDRVRRGIYSVRPLGAVASPHVSSALVLLVHLLGDEQYYVGGQAAMMLHHLLPDSHASDIDVFVGGHRPSRNVGTTRIVFHRAARWAFDFGLADNQVDGVRVVVSDPERTLLDLLAWPQLPCGINLAMQFLGTSAQRLRPDRLIAYALRWPTTSTQQRLGLLLERNGVDARTLEPLATRVSASAGVPSLLPGARRVGGVHPVWRLVLNDGRGSTLPGAIHV